MTLEFDAVHWKIKGLFVSGDNTIVVRGAATGTPIKTFLGAEPTSRSFRTMSIDVENRTAALRQFANV